MHESAGAARPGWPRCSTKSRPTSSSPTAKAARIPAQATAQSADAVKIDYQQPGRVQFNNLLDLVGVKTRVVQASNQAAGGNGGGGKSGQAAVAVAGGGGATAANDSRTVDQRRLRRRQAAMRDYLPKLFDNFAVNASTSIPGRININQAPQAAPARHPGPRPRRQSTRSSARATSRSTADRPERAYETWLLTDGIVDLDDDEKADAAGYRGRQRLSGPNRRLFRRGRPRPTGSRRSSTPRKRPRSSNAAASWSNKGPGYTLDVLGGRAETTPRSQVTTMEERRCTALRVTS